MVELVRGLVERSGAGFEIQLETMWCHVRPRDHELRDQGWKLHVSATRASAGTVLERAVEVLLAQRCAFKFAKALDRVRLLNSGHYPRGGAGKFLTAYPDDDAHFRRVAWMLDEATAGLAGPSILSDRALRPGSLVHYRYGGFVGNMVLSDDGYYRPMIRAAHGGLVEDRRDAWFAPPEGVLLPVGGDTAAPAVAAVTPRPVLLAGRFTVRQALRHANRGGVYWATDAQTGAEVVVKEARPHVEAPDQSRDAQDALRHEAEMLDLLAPLGIAPRKLALFEQGGHLFLAQELVEGVGLREWVAERSDGEPGVSWPLARDLVRRLAELLRAVHATGLALRDLTPNNVLVTDDGEPRIVDLELAAPIGAASASAGTLGYAAPEQIAGAPVAAPADLFSLGAIGFLLATGCDPAFAKDDPPVRSATQRVGEWLAAVAGHSAAARRLTPLVLGLTAAEPERRWDLERVTSFLAYPEASDAPPAPQAVLDVSRVVEDGLAHLLATMAPSQPRLWPSTAFGELTDPCAVQHGAAGAVAVLAQALRASDDPRLRDGLRTACAWVERRMGAEPRVLPGLYFGRSGTAWALHDAARTLGDEGMAARALALAKRVPISWPNPDVAHGMAGAGLAQLALWQATGDDELRDSVERCADGLVAAAEHRPGGVVWPIPADLDSLLAGQTYYGFAHGVAGIAWFLLAAGRATARGDLVDLAVQAGETLRAAAWREDGCATWGEGPDDEFGRFVHWCHGSSGVGTFLARLWQVTGDGRARELAEMAAVAVRRTRWLASPAACHGLAGNGEFLLDLADAFGEPRYRAWASELAEVMAACAAYRNGRLVVPDESKVDVVADYGVGLAGAVAFLMRLRDGGPRLWMADPVAVAGATR